MKIQLAVDLAEVSDRCKFLKSLFWVAFLRQSLNHLQVTSTSVIYRQFASLSVTYRQLASLGVKKRSQ
jgi:hypothetical protein